MTPRDMGIDAMKIVAEVAGHKLTQILQFVTEEKIVPLEAVLRLADARLQQHGDGSEHPVRVEIARLIGHQE